MTYDGFRHFADSYGLLFLGFLFLILVAWVFRKGARRYYDRASRMIFDEEDRKDG